VLCGITKKKNGGNNLIKCVIFDLDDTLCDYKGAMENAKQSVNIHLKKANIDTCIFWKIYHELEPSLFKKFTEKKITKDMYRLKRYSDVLEILSVKNTELSLKLNDIYMKKANNEINLFEDVVPLLEKLKEQNIDTALLTNGPVDGQRQKIKALGLEEFISSIYISEEIGFAKPDNNAFNYVLNTMKLEPANVLVIGDSLEYDIEGAKRAQIKGVLIDRENKHVNYQDDKISNLIDLLKILNKLEKLEYYSG